MTEEAVVGDAAVTAWPSTRVGASHLLDAGAGKCGVRLCGTRGGQERGARADAGAEPGSIVTVDRDQGGPGPTAHVARHCSWLDDWRCSAAFRLQRKKMANVKVGICVVYLVDKRFEWVLDVHTDAITSNTRDVDYTIYAAANRLEATARARLESVPNLKIVELPMLTEKGSKEHGRYLDMLIRHAVQDGCSHVCSLDVDSWPIRPNWASELIEKLDSSGAELAAVLRAELGDSWLPHPCGLFATRAFIERYDPAMWPPDQAEPGFSEFISATGQRLDTGIGFGYFLWKHGLPWLKLTRSNARDDHYLMAGIYQDTFFHLGATSRLKIFHKEFSATWARRVVRPLARAPVVWKHCYRIEMALLKTFPPGIHRENCRTFDAIVARLAQDPEGYYSYLRGKA
jgi:hypothetical protein